MSYTPGDGGYQQQPYPPQGYSPQHGAAPGYPQPPAKPKGGCLKTGAIVIAALFGLLIVAGVVAALAGGDDPETAGDTPEAGSDAPAGDVYAIGETAHTGDFDVTVHTVTDPFTPANEFDLQPAATNRFVAVELTMTNTSDQPLPVSTALGVEMTDHLDRLGSYSIAGASELPHIDTPTVAPGAARRGWVVFEVAADAADLKLRVKGNLTASGSVFQLT